MVTEAPKARAATCSDYATTTSFAFHVCPEICVAEADSSLCPILLCPLIPVTCASGSTFTTPPIPPTTSIISTVTSGCTVTVEAERGCSLCGCVGCPECVAVS